MALWMVQHGHQSQRKSGGSPNGDASGVAALRLLAAAATREEG